MNIIQSIILGVIEGFTEFLPISSTAHLIIASSLLKIPTSDFLKTFEISIQLGAMLSIILLYLKKIFSSWRIIRNITAGFIPTAIIGLAMYKIVKSYLMESLPLIAATLLVGGLIILCLERRRRRKKIGLDEGTKLEDMTIRQSVLTGIFQSLAIIPGVSRSAATIIGGQEIGISRQAIVEFSFLLALPTMFSATVLDLIKTPMDLSGQQWVVWAIGFAVSFATAIIGVRFLLKFIKKNDFVPFGWYRIILAVAIIAFLYLL